MKKTSSISVLIFIVILLVGAIIEYSFYQINLSGLWILAIAFIIGWFISSTIKIADQWDRAVVLRLGQFRALKGPGLFFIVPIIDKIPYWIDVRVLTTSFKAEKTLTKDTVPVDVDAVLF
jgi:regulator of protease activity HflC (stomatin/prohibitin superfamily)